MQAIGRWLLIGVVLAACRLEPDLVACGDRLCPTGSLCVAESLCATQAQVDACADVLDGATCSLVAGVGRCDRGVCILAGCGNGVSDVGEACDDGNTDSGDGCRGDCEKVEICGDAIVDNGEACDDGNDNPSDGCDICVSTTWHASTVIGGSLTATSVALEWPGQVAVDRYGNLYIADTFGHRVRRVDASGILTTIAGTGNLGFSGDGGTATAAKLAHPSAVAVDGLGNVYIADGDNGRIRRVDPSGMIDTVAGTGVAGYAGDGGPATSAQLQYPQGIAVDGLGNLYIADTFNERVRRVDLAGTIMTVAGTGTGGFSGDDGPATAARLWAPFDVEVDHSGTLYIADQRNHRVRRVDAGGTITTVAGDGTPGFAGDGGAATVAQLFDPQSVAIDGDGNLFIADTLNHRIRRVDANGVITTVVGTGTEGAQGDGTAATSAQLSTPQGVAVDAAGALHISDGANHRIRRVTGAGIIETWAGTGAVGFSGDGGAATSAELLGAQALAVAAAGALYIADSNHHQLRRVDATGVITTIAGTGVSGYLGDGGPANQSPLWGPRDVAIDPSGTIFIADTFNYRVRRIESNGVITTVAGTGLAGFEGDGGPATSARLDVPSGIVADGLGYLYIADQQNHRIRRVDPTGVITTIAGNGTAGFAGDGGLATSAQLRLPSAIALDGDYLYIADTFNHRIRRVDQATGIITTVAGTGVGGFGGDGGAAASAQIQFPQDVAVDVSGLVYIADSSNHRIRRVDDTGTITTIAGNGAMGFGGDGSAATNATLWSPSGIALEPGGTLFISDRTNKVVRRVSAGIVTTVAGAIDPEGMGPVGQARLADPRGLVRAPGFTLVAGGSTGTVQAARTGTMWLEVVAGRYPQPVASGASARFQSDSFGAIRGIAYDATGGVIYVAHSNRIDAVTIVDADDEQTWTIAPFANSAGLAGHADGAVAVAQFRELSGLYFDDAARQLYVADTGNHVVRAIDLAGGTGGATVRTIAGTAMTRGFSGDGGAATSGLLFAPRAITRCANGDLFVADTGNQRVRRIEEATAKITTVLGDGVASSSGEGSPATTFPIHDPLGLACDAIGNLFVTSTTTVRLLTASGGIIDGTGDVQTVYGAPPRATFPASVTRCLSGVVIVDSTTVHVADSCTGLLVQLHLEPVAP